VVNTVSLTKLLMLSLARNLLFLEKIIIFGILFVLYFANLVNKNYCINRLF
jgi:hypothetical protein